MRHIHFIINPIAGSGKHKLTFEFLSKYFTNKNYVLKIKYSNYKKHAAELALDSLKEEASIIVACGGDGTINEVASALVNTTVLFGIIPVGSGNGLASNLKIPKNIEKAIEIIKKQAFKTIDVGCINKQYFFSNMGIGFDANVVKKYEESKSRRLSSYIIATIKAFIEFDYNTEVEIVINNNIIATRPFLVFISNSNELGYNISLTPKASLSDGLLDVLIVSKISKLRALLFGVYTLLKRPYNLKEVESLQSKYLRISSNNKTFFQSQIDGEQHQIEGNSIDISIKEKSLTVLV